MHNRNSRRHYSNYDDDMGMGMGDVDMMNSPPPAPPVINTSRNNNNNNNNKGTTYTNHGAYENDDGLYHPPSSATNGPRIITTSAKREEEERIRLEQALSQNQQKAPPQMQHNPQLVTQTRCLRRLYVGGLPTKIPMTEAIIRRYFTLFMKALGFTTPDPVMDVSLSGSARNFCFVEFRSVWDTDAVLHLMDGAFMGGFPLKLNRPKDYHGCPEGLKHYIVAYPPGSHQPPSYVSNTEWLSSTNDQNQHLIQGVQEQLQHEIMRKQRLVDDQGNPLAISPDLLLSTTIMRQPLQFTRDADGELSDLNFPTFEDEMSYIAGLSQSDIDSVVNKFRPFLKPLQKLEQNIPDVELTNMLTSNIRVLKITNLVMDPGQLVDDSIWLNICDDLREWILTKFYPSILGSDIMPEVSDNGLVEMVVLARAAPPLNMGEDAEIDFNTGEYQPKEYKSLNPAVATSEWKPAVDKIKWVGPFQHPERVGECYIICQDFVTAYGIYDELFKSIYYTQLLRVEYCDYSVVESILS